MHSTTQKKIEFLQGYVKRNIKRFHKLDPENITSVRVDKKQSREMEKSYYSIVFNVKVKRGKTDLSKKNIIPPSINVKFPDGETKTVKTDVIETGEFLFHFEPTDPVVDVASGERGAAGPFFHDPNLNAFVLTSFHVAARSLLNQNIFQFDASSNPPYSDLVNGTNCRLTKGAFNPDMDAAFVFVGNNAAASNSFPDGQKIDNQGVVPGPIPPSARGHSVFLYPPSKGGVQITRVITENAGPLITSQVTFRDLVYVNLCTMPGDSGSAVVDENFRLLGIVLGGDTRNTYIVPYYKITSLMNLRLI